MVRLIYFKEAGKSFWELPAPNGKDSSPSGCQPSLGNAKARGKMRPRREPSDVIPWELPTRKYSVLCCNHSLLFVVVFRARLTPKYSPCLRYLVISSEKQFPTSPKW